MMLASKLFQASIWSEVGLRQGKSVTDSPATHSSVGPYSFRQPPLLAFSFYTHSWSTFTFQSKLVLPTGDQRSFQKPNVIKFFRETAPVQSYGRTQYPTAAPYPYRTATIYSQTRTTHCFLDNRNWSWFHRSLSVDTFLGATYSKFFITWRGSDLWENIWNLTHQIICSSRLKSTLREGCE